MRSRSSPTPSSSSPSSPRRRPSTWVSTQPPSSASRRVASARSSAPASRAASRRSSPARRSRSRGTSPAAQVFRTGKAGPGTAPIRVGARLWGALVAEGGDPVRLLELALAAQPAVAFADASAQLGALATRDPLTNLPDHRAFHEQLRSESRRAQRHERALSLVLDQHRRLQADQRRARAPRRRPGAGGGRPPPRRDRPERRARLPALCRPLRLDPPRDRRLERLDRRRAGTTLARRRADRRDRPRHCLGGRLRLRGRRRRRRAARARGVALVHAKSSGGDATFRYSAELDGDDGELAVEDDRGLSRLRALARELDAEDPGTEGHSERVSRLSEKLALSCGWHADLAIRLAQAALLHDVGKLGIGEAVLRKPGPLSEGRARADPQPSGHGRRDRRQGARRGAARLDPPPSRALGRRRLPERRRRRGDPGRSSAARSRRGVGLDDVEPGLRRARCRSPTRVAECKRERGTQFAPEAVDALDRLWALGALDAADVRAAFDRLAGWRAEALQRRERDLPGELVCAAASATSSRVTT